MERKDYNKAFSKELKKLNAAQKIAVNQIEGPVLVIAGPGTGKTHILTSRIGRILLETDTQPHNILCLTFTDAGVHAMRERLLELIGPEAHRVHIFTFHSFCNKIIKERMELFGRHDLEPLSDLERVEMIRKIVDELPQDHPIKQGKRDRYFYESQLYDLFQRMKSEDWSVPFVHKKIDEYLDSLPTRPEYIYQRKTKTANKGDLKTAKLEEQSERMERLRAAAALFPAYSRAMYRARRYDFADMILWVLREFERNEALLRNYQEQYLYFLVDEYQDTNGSQNAILHRLIEYWDNPNVFIVGDDDQSIFEFQGARLKNLLDFHHDFEEDLTLVLLKDNYRSSQKILDSSKVLIDNNQHRAVAILEGLEKDLKAKNKTFARTKTLPKITAYPNRAHEDADIVAKIEQLQIEGFPLREVAIIFAKHKQGRNIIDLLEKKGIPYNTRRSVNILEQPMIQNLRLFLEYIAAEYAKPYSGEYLFFKIMHFDFLQIEPQDLAKLSFYIAKQEKKPMWRDLIADTQKVYRLDLENNKSVLSFSKLLNQLIGSYGNLTLPSLVEKIVNRSGLLYQILQQPDKEWQVQVLSTFLDFVKIETDRNPRITLQRLLDILKNMDDNHLAIGVNKSVVTDDGVNLMTAHSSKGLEFQRVFIIDAVKDNWEPTRSTSAYRFPMPDTLTFSGEEDALEAKRRLFYVAMTRAQEELHISFAQKDQKGKAIQHTIFVDEITANSKATIESKELTKSTLLDAQILLLKESENPRIPATDKARIDELLADWTMSISSLNQFIRCPLSFYYEKILRIPTTSSEAAAFGTAMHYALQKLFDVMRYSKTKEFPDVPSLVRYFEEDMYRQRGYFTTKEFERRMEMGKVNLKKYYEQHIATWKKEVQTEFVVRNVEVEGVPLTGIIDRLDYYPNNAVHIVDYKTGSHNDTKMRPPTSRKPEGGNYWRQLIFYKILLEAAQKSKPQKIQSAEISYLDPNSRGEFITKQLQYDPKDTSVVRDLIKSSYTKIRNHEFYEGCGEKSCPWCQFVKRNIPQDSLRDVEVEELDD
ncbi:MAG: ATP-dependent DNA helicase [Bacteroidota bacterium]